MKEILGCSERNFGALLKGNLDFPLMGILGCLEIFLCLNSKIFFFFVSPGGFGARIFLKFGGFSTDFWGKKAKFWGILEFSFLNFTTLKDFKPLLLLLQKKII